MLDKIIVPLDGSDLAEQILPYAGALASRLDLPLELLHVVDPEALRVTREQEEQGIFVDKLEQRVESWALAYLNALARRLSEQGMTATVKVTLGTPDQAIVAAAQHNGRDMIAMATHGRAGIARAVLGSVADKVLHAGHMPLLLFRPRHDKEFPARAPKTLIVPLNFPGSEEALPMARFLAQHLGAKALLVRVVPHFAYATPQPAAVGAGVEHDRPALAEVDARMYLNEQAHSFYEDRLSAEAVVVSGDSGKELIKLAARTPEALIVMATHARAGIPRLVLGSVAERVVHGLGAPVLVIRPQS